MLDIKFGSPTANNQNSIYLVSLFLCGFRKFAQSIRPTRFRRGLVSETRWGASVEFTNAKRLG